MWVSACFCQHCEGFPLIQHDIRDSFLPTLSLTRLLALNSRSLCSMLIPLMLKSLYTFEGKISFVRVFYSQNRIKTVAVLFPFSTSLWSLQHGEVQLYFFLSPTAGFPPPHLADPPQCRGPAHPWSTGRCRCSWRPRRTVPPFLPAPPIGLQAPGRSECTMLRQKNRDGDQFWVFFSLWTGHELSSFITL